MPATTWLHISEDKLSSNFVPLNDHMELTGLARCYKLSEPKDLDGDGVPDEYVVVRILYRREHMHAEIALFPSDATGCLRGTSVMRRMGSFPLVPCPKGNPDAIEYAIAVAFKFYDITVTDPPEPEPEPEPAAPEKQLPEGLDYDPSEIPTYDKPNNEASAA